MSLSRRSTTGNLFKFLYNRSQISWQSKLQKTIALSTAEAKYYSASRAAVEVIYLRYLLHSMVFAPKSWTHVYEDNNACIEWTNNIIGGRERAKLIEIRKPEHFRVAQAQSCSKWTPASGSGQHLEAALHQGTSCPALGSLC